jgi:hypothetical protein
VDQNARTKQGWLTKWRERRQRKNARLAERLSKRPPRLSDAHTAEQAEQAARSVPTSSGGLIG